MKKAFKIMLSTLIILSFCSFTIKAEENIQDTSNSVISLSSFGEQECQNFLLENGIVIPKGISSSEVVDLIVYLEAYPYAALTVDDPILVDFIEEVRGVVWDYLQLEASASTLATSSYTLQNSTLYSWKPLTMINYNCYAYVLGRTSWAIPGEFSGGTYDDSLSITSLTSLVEDDLNALGYDCVKIQTTRPSSKGIWSYVIAVRKATTADINGNKDFHFAILNGSSWYHKPGATAVLKFNSAPSNSVAWTNESYDGTYNEPSIIYDSDIKYLLYKLEHGDVNEVYAGSHYHSGNYHYYKFNYKCDDCGDTIYTAYISIVCSGPPCQLEYGSIDDVVE